MLQKNIMCNNEALLHGKSLSQEDKQIKAKV